jgi:2-iminobutanoate/2-iminopropanoate deaminase
MKSKIVAVLMLAFCVMANAADRKHIVKPRPADQKALPFSDAVLAGETLYVAGHLGTDPKTGQAPDDPEQEAKLVMESVKQTVESAGFAMDDIVSVQVYCTDLKYYEAFNGVYKTYFHGDFPARAFVGVAKLLRSAKFEVMATAIKK